MNVALGKELEGNRQGQFLALIDRFTELHLILLRFLDDPSGYCRSRGIQVPTVPPGRYVLAAQLVSGVMPALMEQLKSTSEDRIIEDRIASLFQFTEMIIGDLVATNLVALRRLNETWAVQGVMGPAPSEVASVTTHLGTDFLEFISYATITP